MGATNELLYGLYTTKYCGQLIEIHWVCCNRYWFECNCIACCQDWPTWEQMKTNTSLRIRCIHCKNAITVKTESMEFAVNCMVCSKTTKLLPVLKVLQVPTYLIIFKEQY